MSLKHKRTDAHSHCRYPEMSERAGERSKASSKSLEGKTGSTEREAQHLRKALEFGREWEQGRRAKGRDAARKQRWTERGDKQGQIEFPSTDQIAKGKQKPLTVSPEPQDGHEREGGREEALGCKGLPAKESLTAKSRKCKLFLTLEM